MTIRSILLLSLAAAPLGACATTAPLPPTEVVRYHLGEPIARGTIAVEPMAASTQPASLEFQGYADAVRGRLLANGYAAAAPGARAEFIASVAFTRTTQPGPPRRSPISIGLGGGSFSGGRHGGVGLGGGVGFPIGGGRGRDVLVAELSVTIKRSADQSPVWEGRAQGVSDIRAADEQAGKLAAALFTGFPGVSGRTITVR